MAIDVSATHLEAVREQAPGADAHADEAAFGQLYDFYLPRIYGFVARRVDGRTAAEEVTAETFERALGAMRRGGFRNVSFAGFLFRVASGAVVDHARRSRRTIPLGVRAGDFDTEGDREAAESISDDAATRAFGVAIDRNRLRKALLGIPDAHRRVILLKYFDQLEIDDLCATLGCSRQEFAIQLHRALRALRSAMDEAATDAT